jgi:hypothetical protein
MLQLNRGVKIIKYFLITVLLFTCYAIAFADESVTISSYHPSPYGSYSELHSNQISIGTAYRSTAIPANGLIISGSVGIGTTTPGFQLDVSGRVAANDIWVQSKSRLLSAADYFVI